MALCTGLALRRRVSRSGEQSLLAQGQASPPGSRSGLAANAHAGFACDCSTSEDGLSQTWEEASQGLSVLPRADPEPGARSCGDRPGARGKGSR